MRRLLIRRAQAAGLLAMAARHRELLSSRSQRKGRESKFVSASRRNPHASRVRSPESSDRAFNISHVLRASGCIAVLAWATIALTSCKKSAPTTSAIDPNGPVEVVLPEKGVYTGAFMDFGDEEDDVSLEIIEDFEKMVGKHQALIASSSYWGEQTFPTDNLNVIWRHGSLPLVFWSPWDKPYTQDRGPDRFSLTDVIAGKWDDYIDKWGDSARSFGHPLIVAFGVEMNGTWFPWSGTFYGADAWDASRGNWKGPANFRAAYRHVVDRVRARGAANIKWMFHTNNYSYPLDTWNFAPAYFPGRAYVDWLGISVYGQQFRDEPWANIPSLVDWPYQEMSSLDPDIPIMIAEWATGEFPRSGNKGAWIKEGLDLFRSRYPRVKAAVYWHERWQNPDQSFSNLRVNSSIESLNAYREGVAHPDWLGNLILRPIKPKAKSEPAR